MMVQITKIRALQSMLGSRLNGDVMIEIPEGTDAGALDEWIKTSVFTRLTPGSVVYLELYRTRKS